MYILGNSSNSSRSTSKHIRIVQIATIWSNGGGDTLDDAYRILPTGGGLELSLLPFHGIEWAVHLTRS